MKKKEIEQIEDNCMEEIVSPFGPPAPIVSVRNHLYLYDEIDKTIARSFTSSLCELALNALTDSVQNGVDLPVIWIHINSYGGSCNDALAIINTINKLKDGTFGAINGIKIPFKIGTIIEGESDSCASLIACCGTKGYRQVAKHSLSMIHEVYQIGGAGGKAEDIKVQSENLDMFKEIFEEIYLENSTLTKETYNEIIKDDRYSRPVDLIQYGLADEII